MQKTEDILIRLLIFAIVYALVYCLVKVCLVPRVPPQTPLTGLRTLWHPASSWRNHFLRQLIRAGSGSMFLGHVRSR